MLFGGPKSDGPWPVDVLTLEYLVSGEVDEPGQKWGWDYFQVIGDNPARPFELVVSNVSPTGSYPTPALVGRRAYFTLESSLVALIPRAGAADVVWDKWNTLDKGVASLLLVGPYTGTVLSPDSQLQTMLLGRALALRDVTITRVAGAGAGATPIQAPRATVLTRALHSAVENP